MFKYCYMHNYFVLGRLLTNQPKTPMEITIVPIATTTKPFIFQSGLLYIKEDEGPKKLLLWAMKTSPNPTMIPPINTIIDAELPIFGDTGSMRLSTDTFICLISFGLGLH
jgi:hypothetical protein